MPKFRIQNFSNCPYDKAVELCDELKAYLPPGLTLDQMAQRWILDHPAVTTVITGASKQTQVLENAAVSALNPLTGDLHQRLRHFYDESVAHHIRGAY